MSKPVLLFDADEVLTVREEVFSLVYARERGIDPEPISKFFKENWKPMVTGKKDLKESLAENLDAWQWTGTVDELLDYWFKTENVLNEAMIKVVRGLKTRGIPCYIATEQEKYRGKYMKEVMFKDIVDGIFITAELGVSKTEPKFFELIIESLKLEHPGIKPSDIMFFDNDQPKVDTATSVGIDGHLFTNVAQIKALLEKI